MKKISTLLAMLFSAYVVFSQRVDLDKYNFSASYIELPKMVMDTSYKTFFVEMDASSTTLKDLGEENLDESVYIQGWKKLPGDGHVKIFIRLEDIFIENFEVKERKEILKDKNGKETGQKTYYYLQLAYTFAAQSKVTDYKGNSVITINLSNREYKQTYNSKEFSSFIEASFVL